MGVFMDSIGLGIVLRTLLGIVLEAVFGKGNEKRR
jgi:hypothetical protein